MEKRLYDHKRTYGKQFRLRYVIDSGHHSAIENEIKTDLISLKIEFWSKTEYDARPDTVWGYE